MSLLHLDDDLRPDPRRSTALRSFHHRAFCAAELVERKDAAKVSVCLPARNERATIGPIVEAIRAELVERLPLVDEVLVLDDHSSDGTAEVAADAGAHVVDAADVLDDHGHGKGEVLWKSLYVAEGDVIVWCDADIRDFHPRFVVGILGPLLTEPDVQFAKGHYSRPELDGTGGGRVTELVARPLLSMFFPELCAVVQPLSGEYGGTRELLERLPFAPGYGVDVALLIDVADAVGLGAMAQVDLDVRHHRNRPLSELSPQAMAVAAAILRRAAPHLLEDPATLFVPSATAPTGLAAASEPITTDERPPLVELATYLARIA